MNPIKDFLPPITVRVLTSFMYGWTGSYNSWGDAEKNSSGYDSDIIINKVKAALLKVKNGEAVFERDSVLFDKVYYSFPLLSALSQIALRSDSKLNVLDFGGSLGSTYFQNRGMFGNLKELKWNIIEQEHFVTEGKKTFADNHLDFYYNIDDCLKEQKVNTLLLGSVLQYIEKPFELLDDMLSKNIEYIVVDRTPVFIGDEERITIQKVPKKIYEAQYPCWILSENKIINRITEAGYELVFDSDSNESMNVAKAHLRGYFFKFKK